MNNKMQSCSLSITSTFKYDQRSNYASSTETLTFPLMPLEYGQ